MRVTIDRVETYDGHEFHWKVITDTDAGFYLSGTTLSYRQACRQAWKAMKRLDGIGWISFETPTKTSLPSPPGQGGK